MLTQRPVLVMEMPEHLNAAEARAFLRELEPLLEFPRPRLVFDCSEVRHIDSAGVAMMLQCLEEAMKQNGNLKLAALPMDSDATLELRQLFEAFATSADAVRSFSPTPAHLRKEPFYSNGFGEDLKKAS